MRQRGLFCVRQNVTTSFDGFLERISEEGIEPYYRGGRLVGVWYGKEKKRKYRLKGLGFETRKKQEIIRRFELEK